MQLKILLAEDDLTSREMLHAVLNKWGYDVISVADGNQAWQWLQENSEPCLAVLDWMMPGLDGLEICLRLRALDRPDPPYAILLTAKGEKGDIVRGLAAGADDYVTKPFDRDELQARIQVGRRMLELREALARQVCELQQAMAHIKTLQGILPICMHCHRIRRDQESWERIEKYITDHSDAQFSHAICPECYQNHYPDYALRD